MRIGLLVPLCLVATAASAGGTYDPSVYENPPAFYLEAGIGTGFVQNVETEPSTFVPGLVFGTGDIEYKNPIAYSGEIGMQVFDNIRLAVSYSQVKVKVRKIDVTGTVGGAPGSITLYPAFQERADVFTANVYYDFPAIIGGIRPFAGAGVGGAHLRDADGAWVATGSLGVRGDINRWAYWGLRYRYTLIGGTTDTQGITYKTSNVHLVSALAGVRF